MKSHRLAIHRPVNGNRELNGAAPGSCKPGAAIARSRRGPLFSTALAPSTGEAKKRHDAKHAVKLESAGTQYSCVSGSLVAV